MSGTQVGGVAIEILDARGGLISLNAREGGTGTVSTFCLNDDDIRVARAMAIDPKAVAMIKYKHGSGGLAGVPLLSNPDDDGEADPGNLHIELGVIFPDGSNNRSRRKKVQS
jgi:hypothetical protein